MATIWDHVSENWKDGVGFREMLLKRSGVILAASLDPLAVAPTSEIPAGTVLAPVPATGKYKPVRMTLADNGCTTGQSSVPVVETSMFAVGDVIVVVAQATPGLTVPLAVGTIASIVAGVSLELTGNATTAVVSGDIVEVAENTVLAAWKDTVVLEATVDLRNAAGTAVDSGGIGVIAGQIAKSALNFNIALGITVTRLQAMMPLMDFVNTVAGVVT
jgi:hypothetical protein